LLKHVPTTWSQLRATDVNKHWHCSYTDGTHSQEVGALWFETQATLSRRAAGPTKTYIFTFIENSLSAFPARWLFLRRRERVKDIPDNYPYVLSTASIRHHLLAIPKWFIILI